MTYPPGSPGNSGYPSGSYGGGPYGDKAPSGPYGPTPGAPQVDPGPSKLPAYLNIAVVVLGIAAYIAAFGPVLTASTNLGPFSVEATSTGGILLTLASVLAALLAAIALLPKTKNHPTVVALLAVLGVLAVVEQIVNKPQAATIGWALWLVLAFVLLQAIAAVLVLLFDTGVLAPPVPRPRYEAPYGGYGQYGSYGAPGGYYGQSQGQPGPPSVGPPASRPGYPSQPSQSYGGYPAGGYGSQSNAQNGPPTPPTGFPSYSPPPAVGSTGGQHHVSDPSPSSSEGSPTSDAGPSTGSSSD
ncbi:MAG TPA: DUF5336 domain-containing protein [Mycobacterium sp.]|nr:DUF5336 domain-containing protein [Mycobacterium sp.]